MIPKYIVLRLRVESKKPSDVPYTPATILYIEETVAKAINLYKIKDKLFEISVKTKNDRMVSCQIKMSHEIYRYFVRAYGSIEALEKDYEIIEKYS